MLSDVFEKWLKKSQKKKGIAIGMKIGIEKGKTLGKESLSESNRNEVGGKRGICGVNLHSRKVANLTNHHQMG